LSLFSCSSGKHGQWLVGLSSRLFALDLCNLRSIDGAAIATRETKWTEG
jgi:hypothetical protein